MKESPERIEVKDFCGHCTRALTDARTIGTVDVSGQVVAFALCPNCERFVKRMRDKGASLRFGFKVQANMKRHLVSLAIENALEKPI